MQRLPAVRVAIQVGFRLLLVLVFFGLHRQAHAQEASRQPVQPQTAEDQSRDQQDAANPLPLLPRCRNVLGEPVDDVPDIRLHDYAMAGPDPTVHPVILYNPFGIQQLAPPVRLFVYEHECGHFAMGHVYRHVTAEAEEEADCYSIVVLADRGMLSDAAVDTIEAAVAKFPEDALHPPGWARARVLQYCLDNYESYPSTFFVPAVLHPEGDVVYVHDAKGVHLQRIPCMHTVLVRRTVTLVRPMPSFFHAWQKAAPVRVAMVRRASSHLPPS
jgi:hypothetical protein